MRTEFGLFLECITTRYFLHYCKILPFEGGRGRGDEANVLGGILVRALLTIHVLPS